MIIKSGIVKGFLTFPFLTFSILPFVSVTGVFSLISDSQFIVFPEKRIEISNVVSENNNSQNLSILKAATNFDPNPAKGGGDISIIDGVALVAETGVSGTILDIEQAAKSAGHISLYEVREGDTLSQISEMFQISVNTIRWANDLDGPIHPGQNLIILPVSGITHVVKNGGTIKDVADIYEADVREIALFNGLDANTNLKPGDKIIVPNVDFVNRETEKNTSNNGTKIAGSNKSVAGSYYSNPVSGGIITQGIHGYNGIDIGASAGTPITAAASGKVITSKQGGWNGGYGNMIVISHNNGTQTLYSHNSSNVVYVGQYVEKGQTIGYVGSTGRSTGNHLHFEVRGAKNPLANCSVGSICR